MKKFVVIMISALVLFTFLMLNYLLWDKENLQKQRESDKIEQDWLRGQNRILTATVDELEQANAALEKEVAGYKDKINDLEYRINLLQQREANFIKRTDELNQILNLYKTLLSDEVREIINDWFLSINRKEYNDSYGFLSEDFTFLGKKIDKTEYMEMISAIDLIEIAEGSGDMADGPFTVNENNEPEIISVQVVVQAYIKDEQKADMPGVDDGTNVLEFRLRYNRLSKKWAILSIVSKNSGNT